MSNPTFKYNPAKHSLDEMAHYPEPDGELSDKNFHEWEDYNVHIASLRSIPCEKDTQWSDGELVEGRDFEVLPDDPESGYPNYVAIPIKQEADADSIDMLKKIYYDLKHFEHHGMTEDFINNYLSKFTITKKQ